MLEDPSTDTVNVPVAGSDVSKKGDLYVPGLKRTKNIAEQLTPGQRMTVASMVCDSTDADISSASEYQLRRAFWRKQFVGTPEAPKRRRFTGSCTAHVPILTVAVMQFAARAEEYLLPSRGIARAKEYSKDRQSIARAERVGDFLQDQLENQIRGFRRTNGLAFTQTAIDGPSFLKCFWNPERKAHEVLSLPAEDIIISYTHSGTIHDVSRITQRIRLTQDEIRTRANDGRFLEENAWSLGSPDTTNGDDGPLGEQRRRTDGVDAPQQLSHGDDGPREMWEQHRTLDLDGDGIGEPYIVTVDKESRKLMRITSRTVRNKQGHDEYVCHYVMYPFQWNPAGFYPLGLGHLLEGLGVVADSLVQQLVDSGTIQNNPGGFIAKGAKVKGEIHYEPGVWTEYDGYIEDLQKAIMIMPTTPPSSTLKEVLGMSQEWSKEISSISDLMQGLAQNTNQTATTSLIMAKQGLTLFNAVFRRLRDALTELLQLIYQLNRLYLDDETYNATLGDNGQPEYKAWMAAKSQYAQMLQVALQMEGMGAEIPDQLKMMLSQPPPEYPFSVEADFTEDLSIMPTADPEVTSEAERVQIAEKVLMIVQNPMLPPTPQALWAAQRRYLEALRVPDIEEVLPPPPVPEGPPPDLGQYSEIAEMLDGKPTPVPPERPPEYHVQHLAAIGEYKGRQQGWWVAQMAPEQKDQLDRHEREHLAALLRLQDQGGQSAGVQLPPGVTQTAPASGPPFSPVGGGARGPVVPVPAGNGNAGGSAPASLLGRMPGLGSFLGGPGGGTPQGS